LAAAGTVRFVGIVCGGEVCVKGGSDW
jgi:hypothetical protein